MWRAHIYLKYDNVLFVWSGECGHQIFILNTATFCLFGQENVDITYLSLNILLTKQTKHCRIKDKFVLSTFSWSNKQNAVVFKISMCSPHSLIRQRFVCLIRRMWRAHTYLKYDNILFVWSGECGEHKFIFNTTTFCCMCSPHSPDQTNKTLSY
jgi:hypothetical protein